LVTGFVLSEWMGGITRPRMQRVARRLKKSAPVRLTSAASVRAVDAALQAEPRLTAFSIEVVAVSRGTVELRGWVTDRSARTLAARVACAVTGIDTVINSILVRGEDDRIIPGGKRVKDQSA
jgi:osmotically-inducible protein OsmY